MFYNDLFTIKSQEVEEGKALFTIQLNPEHRIYKGHFPGDGITPGVCILQIACDLFSHIQQKPFVISFIKKVKFMQLIRPSLTPEVTYEFSYQSTEKEGEFEAKCTVTQGQTTMTQTSLDFRPIHTFVAE